MEQGAKGKEPSENWQKVSGRKSETAGLVVSWLTSDLRRLTSLRYSFLWIDLGLPLAVIAAFWWLGIL